MDALYLCRLVAQCLPSPPPPHKGCRKEDFFFFNSIRGIDNVKAMEYGPYENDNGNPVSWRLGDCVVRWGLIKWRWKRKKKGKWKWKSTKSATCISAAWWLCCTTGVCSASAESLQPNEWKPTKTTNRSRFNLFSAALSILVICVLCPSYRQPIWADSEVFQSLQFMFCVSV